MKTRFIKLILLLVVIFFVLFMFPVHEKEKSQNPGLIAIVNGTNIFADDVNKITKMIDIMNLNQLTDKQLQEGVQKHRVTSLLGKIRQVIIEQKIKEYDITASEREIQDKINETFANIDSNSVQIAIERSNAVNEALERWQKEPSKSDDIYNEILSPLDIKKDQWELSKIIYDTPEKIRQMQIPKTLEDMKKFSYESAKRDLLFQKLMDSVANDNTKTEEQKTAIQTAWWNEQYKNAKIEIFDPNYNEAINILQTGDN